MGEKRRKSFYSIILMTICGIVFVSVFSMAIWLYVSLKKSIRKEFIQSVQMEATRLEGTLKQRLTEILYRTRELALDNTCRISLALGLEPELNEILRDKNARGEEVHYAVMDTSGQFFPTGMGEDLTAQLRYLVAESGASIQRPAIGPRFYNYLGNLFVGYVVPVKKRKELLGYVLAMYDPSDDIIVKGDFPSSIAMTLVYKTKNGFVDWFRESPAACSAQLTTLSSQDHKNIIQTKDFILVPFRKFENVYVCAKTTPLKDKQLSLLRTMILICGFVFSFMVIFSILLWFGMKETVSNITRQFDIIAREPLNRRVDLSSLKWSEFVDLGKAFNTVLDSFREVHEKLTSAMEMKLDSLGKRFEALVNYCPLGILLLDSNYRILYANPQFSRMVEGNMNKIVGANLSHFLKYPSNINNNFIQTCLKKPLEARLEKLSNSDVMWVEVRCSKIKEYNETLIAVLVMDITSRKKAEENRNLLIHAINQIEHSVVITDLDWKILYANRAFMELLNVGSDEIVGRHIDKIRKKVISNLPTVNEIEHTIKENGVWSHKIILETKKGHRFVDATILAVKTTGVVIDYYVMVLKDITEYLEAEQRLREKQKMEALGVLAAGIAHDFNNILTVITTSVDLLHTYLSSCEYKEETERYISNVRDAIGKAKGIIAQVFAFARVEETGDIPQSINLVPLVKETARLVKSGAPPGIKVVTNIERDNAFVAIDPSQVHQIIMNLAKNGIDAMKDGGILEIGLKKEFISSEKGRRLGVEEGEYVVLWVQDTGTGIPQELINRIFEPYFTTKPLGEGTGLGLSIVHSIVTKVGGAIDVQSEAGKGTRFMVYLKKAKKYLETSQETPPQDKGHKGVEKLQTKRIKIIVLDDEEYISSLVKELLVKRGFDAVNFTDPEALCEYLNCEEHKEPDLIITDYSMPNINGVEVIKRLRRDGISAPVILMSGYLRVVSDREREELNIPAIIAKPFSTSELLNNVESVLIEKNA